MAERRLLTLKRAILGALALVLAGVLYVGYGILQVVNVTIPHSYAAWETGHLMVEYLKMHDGKWPRGWGDLREADESLRRKGTAVYWELDRLPAIVKIDWDVDPQALASLALSNSDYRLKVVTQADGSRLEANWGEDTEPNAKIKQYLVAVYSASNSQSVANGGAAASLRSRSTSPRAASRRSP